MARRLKGLIRMRSLSVPLFALIGSAGVLSAQQNPASESDQPPATFKSGVDVVSVTLSVRDRRGRVVRDLTQSEFTVFDSGEPVEIDDFYSGDAPVSLSILLDISGSMAVGGNIGRAREAVAVTASHLRGQTDEASLFTFDSELREVVGFTSVVEHIHRVSLAGEPWGQTSLYDAIGRAAQSVAERANRHRALLVITDGVDTASRLTAPEVSGIASAIDVPVYLLTVVTPLDHPGTEFEALGDGREERTGTLSDLARWTGGDMRIASTPSDVSRAVQDVFEELRYQYVISFEPGSRSGWHPLEIRTRRRGLVVHARGGYMSGRSRNGSQVVRGVNDHAK